MLPKAFSVLVADQYSVTRAGVKAMLAREKCKVFEADNGRDAVRLAVKHRPHIAVLDITMPHLDGLLAAHQIITAGTGTRVLLLTAKNDDWTIERAMHFRIHGYLCKTTPIEKLTEAIRTLRSGLTWFDATVQSHFSRYAHIPGYALRDPLPLTEREIEILTLIAGGNQNKEIAGELGLSEKTVDRHRQNLMQKLNIHDIAGLTRYAMRAGIVETR